MKTVGLKHNFYLIKNYDSVYDFINNFDSVTTGVMWREGQPLKITKLNSLEFDTECMPIIVL